MPITLKEYERLLDAPALCEQLRIRDLLDNVAIQLDGSFVAAYELGGLPPCMRATKSVTATSRRSKP